MLKKIVGSSFEEILNLNKKKTASFNIAELEKELGIKNDLSTEDLKFFNLNEEDVKAISEAKDNESMTAVFEDVLEGALEDSELFRKQVQKEGIFQDLNEDELNKILKSSVVVRKLEVLINHLNSFYSAGNAEPLIKWLREEYLSKNKAQEKQVGKVEITPERLKMFKSYQKDIEDTKKPISIDQLRNRITWFLGIDIEGRSKGDTQFKTNRKENPSSKMGDKEKQAYIEAFIDYVKSKQPENKAIKEDTKKLIKKLVGDIKKVQEVPKFDTKELYMFGLKNTDDVAKMGYEGIKKAILHSVGLVPAGDGVGAKTLKEDKISEDLVVPKEHYPATEDELTIQEVIKDRIDDLGRADQMDLISSFLSYVKNKKDEAGIPLDKKTKEMFFDRGLKDSIKQFISIKNEPATKKQKDKVDDPYVIRDRANSVQILMKSILKPLKDREKDTALERELNSLDKYLREALPYKQDVSERNKVLKKMYKDLDLAEDPTDNERLKQALVLISKDDLSAINSSYLSKDNAAKEIDSLKKDIDSLMKENRTLEDRRTFLKKSLSEAGVNLKDGSLEEYLSSAASDFYATEKDLKEVDKSIENNKSRISIKNKKLEAFSKNWETLKDKVDKPGVQAFLKSFNDYKEFLDSYSKKQEDFLPSIGSIDKKFPRLMDLIDKSYKLVNVYNDLDRNLGLAGYALQGDPIHPFKTFIPSKKVDKSPDMEEDPVKKLLDILAEEESNIDKKDLFAVAELISNIGDKIDGLGLEDLEDIINNILKGKKDATKDLGYYKDKLEESKKNLMKLRTYLVAISPEELFSKIRKKLSDLNTMKFLIPREEKSASEILKVASSIREAAWKMINAARTRYVSKGPGWSVYGKRYRIVRGQAIPAYQNNLFDRPDFVSGFVDSLLSHGFNFFKTDDKGNFTKDIKDFDTQIDKTVAEVLEKGKESLDTKIFNKVGAARTLERNKGRALKELRSGINEINKLSVDAANIKNDYLPKLEEFAKFFKDPLAFLRSQVDADTMDVLEGDLGSAPKADQVSRLERAIINKDIATIEKMVPLYRDTEERKKTLESKDIVDDYYDIEKAKFKPYGEEQTDPLAKEIIKNLKNRFLSKNRLTTKQREDRLEKAEKDISNKKGDLKFLKDRNSFHKSMDVFLKAVSPKKKLVYNPYDPNLFGSIAPEVSIIDNSEELKKKLYELKELETNKNMSIKNWENASRLTKHIENIFKSYEVLKNNFERGGFKGPIQTINKELTKRGLSVDFKFSEDFEAFIKQMYIFIEDAKKEPNISDEDKENLENLKDTLKKEVEEYRSIEEEVESAPTEFTLNIGGKEVRGFENLKKQLDFLKSKMKSMGIDEPGIEINEKEDVAEAAKMNDEMSAIQTDLNKISKQLSIQDALKKLKPIIVQYENLRKDYSGMAEKLREKFEASLTVKILRDKGIMAELPKTDSVEKLLTTLYGYLNLAKKKSKEIGLDYKELANIDRFKKHIKDLEREYKKLEKSLIEAELKTSVNVGGENLKGIDAILSKFDEYKNAKLAATGSGKGGEPGEDAPTLHDLATLTLESKEKLETPKIKIREKDILEYFLGKDVEDLKETKEDISFLDKYLNDDLINKRKDLLMRKLTKIESVKKRKKLLDKKYDIAGESLTLKEISERFRDILDEYIEKINKANKRRTELKKKIDKAQIELASIKDFVDPETGEYREFTEEEKKSYRDMFYQQLFFSLNQYWNTAPGRNFIFGEKSDPPYTQVFNTFKNVTGLSFDPKIGNEIRNIDGQLREPLSNYTKGSASSDGVVVDKKFKTRLNEVKAYIKEYEDLDATDTKNYKFLKDEERKLERLNKMKKELKAKMSESASAELKAKILREVRNKIKGDKEGINEALSEAEKEADEVKKEVKTIVGETELKSEKDVKPEMEKKPSKTKDKEEAEAPKKESEKSTKKEWKESLKEWSPGKSMASLADKFNSLVNENGDDKTLGLNLRGYENALSKQKDDSGKEETSKKFVDHLKKIKPYMEEFFKDNSEELKGNLSSFFKELAKGSKVKVAYSDSPHFNPKHLYSKSMQDKLASML